MKTKQKTKQVRIDERLHRYLKGEAFRRGVTVADLVDVAITYWLENESNGKKRHSGNNGR